MKSNSEVPIFLRKTYHMVDSCDPAVASWSEDGETFIVKQPETFSSKIIPQFFKHSKFSSFVRQLNFYGFRKIKYSDSIKINEELEKETKDYWRFRHDCFRRGREDLLVGIKRSNSTQNEKKTVTTASKSPAHVEESKEEVIELKQELNTLKDTIAKMSDNIDILTNLVQNVNLGENKIKQEDDVKVGSKRKKMDESEQGSSETAMDLDAVMSSSTDTLSVDNDMTNIAFTPSNIFPAGTVLRQASASSNLSDAAFVDELFNALDDGEMEILPEPVTSEIVPEMVSSLSSIPTEDIPVTPPDSPIHTSETFNNISCQANPNSPDVELMTKLSDALTVLPKDMQELLVNRLIATITSSDALKAHLDSITGSSDTSLSETHYPQRMARAGSALENNPEVALPLAAATLTALMTHLSASMKNNKACVTNGKSLPLIPIHA